MKSGLSDDTMRVLGASRHFSEEQISPEFGTIFPGGGTGEAVNAAGKWEC